MTEMQAIIKVMKDMSVESRRGNGVTSTLTIDDFQVINTLVDQLGLDIGEVLLTWTTQEIDGKTALIRAMEAMAVDGQFKIDSFSVIKLLTDAVGMNEDELRKRWKLLESQRSEAIKNAAVEETR